MLGIRITAFGGPENLVLNEEVQPPVGAGEVLIRVGASGVNRPDVSQRLGMYPPPPGISELPGLEMAGEVVEGDLGSESNAFGLKRGDRVCALVAGGGYAEYCVAPLAQCLPVPAGLTDVQAASLPETFFTVWSNLFDLAGLHKDGASKPQDVLVHGAGSGIGVAAIQMATALGHRVWTTAGSQAKCDAAVRLGAHRAINYRDEDFEDVVNSETDGVGVHIVLDMVGGDYLQRNLDCIRADGHIALIAVLGGTEAKINLLDVLMKRVAITGNTLRARSVLFKSLIARNLYQHIWPALEDGRIVPEIHSVFSPIEAAQAHRLMESNEHIGKIVIDWSLLPQHKG